MDLCRLCTGLGAHIDGTDSPTRQIEGPIRLRGGTAAVGPDYLEVGSFIALAALTGGGTLIPKARPQDHPGTASAYGRPGVRWEVRGDDIFVPSGQELVVQEGLQGEIPSIH